MLYITVSELFKEFSNKLVTHIIGFKCAAQ